MISLGYNNEHGIAAVIEGFSSVMEAYHEMDKLIKLNRVFIDYGVDGEISQIRACVILDTKHGRHVYFPDPSKYTLSHVEVRANMCLAHTYEVRIKAGQRTILRTMRNSVRAATLYVHVMRAGLPVFLKRDNVIVAADNCGPKWEKYSIHFDPSKAKPEPEPEAEPVKKEEPDIPDFEPDIWLAADDADYPMNDDGTNIDIPV